MNYLTKNLTILFPLLIIYSVLLFVFWIKGLGNIQSQVNIYASDDNDLAVLQIK